MPSSIPDPMSSREVCMSLSSQASFTSASSRPFRCAALPPLMSVSVEKPPPRGPLSFSTMDSTAICTTLLASINTER